MFVTQVIDRESATSGANAALALTLVPKTKHQGSALLIYSVEVAFSATSTTTVVTITRTAHTGTAADDRVIFTQDFTGDDFIWSPAQNPVMDLIIMPDEQLLVDVAAAGSAITAFAVIYYGLVS